MRTYRIGVGSMLVGAAALLLSAGSAQAQWTTGAAGVIHYNSGRVGIGTTTPAGQLHVIGATGLGAIRGENTGTGAAVVGWSQGASGVSYGTYGQSHSTLGYGALGWATNSSGQSIGVYGQCDSSTGFAGLFKGGQFGAYGWANAATGNTVGVYGRVSSPNGWGGIFKGGYYGVWGETNQTNGFGGYFLGRGYFRDPVGFGVVNPIYPMEATTSTALYGMYVQNTSNEAVTGVRGEATSGTGVGVSGVGTSPSGTPIGVFGQIASATNGVGVSGYSYATTGSGRGVEGTSDSSIGVGVYGISNSLTSTDTGPAGVRGVARSDPSFGVVGEVIGTTNTTAIGVVGINGSVEANAYAVFAAGKTGASGTKAFQIDHPLDPANKTLTHYSAEGPEPYLMYRGNVVLDGSGEAEVQLPAYFDSINRDIHYQLTAIGAPAVLYVAEEVSNNHFRIAGGQSGMKVSWTVTGVRNDEFCRQADLAIEADKPAHWKGKYLMPGLYGMSESMGVFYRPLPQGSPMTKVPPTTRSLTAPSKAVAAPEPVVPQPTRLGAPAASGN